MLVVRAIPGLGVAAPLSTVLGPLHGRAGEVPRRAFKKALNRTDDSLGFASARSAPEGVVESAKLLMYFAAIAASDVNDLTHLRPPVLLRPAWRSRSQLVDAV